jgi:hypothetical protein
MSPDQFHLPDGRRMYLSISNGSLPLVRVLYWVVLPRNSVQISRHRFPSTKISPQVCCASKKQNPHAKTKITVLDGKLSGKKIVIVWNKYHCSTTPVRLQKLRLRCCQLPTLKNDILTSCSEWHFHGAPDKSVFYKTNNNMLRERRLVASFSSRVGVGMLCSPT